MSILRAIVMLLAHVGLGAVGRHADGAHAQVVRHLQVVDGADARQQQAETLARFISGITAERYSSSVAPESRS